MKLFTILLCFTFFAVFSNPGECQNGKTATDSAANRNNLPEADFSGRKARETMVVLYGVTSIEQFNSFQAAAEKTRGINSVKSPGFRMGQISFNINTVLTTEELVKSVKSWNPQLYYSVSMAIDEMIAIITSKRPFPQEKATNPVTAPNNESQTKPDVIAEKPDIDDDYNKVFTKVETEADFPGGYRALGTYLGKNLNLDIPKKNSAPAGSYTVTIRFIVAKDGTISDMEALSHIGYGMENEAMRVIKTGPKWVPGANGVVEGQLEKAVKSYRTLRVVFTVVQ